MCIDVRKTCVCGKHRIQFHLRDNIMSEEVIARLFCPDCSGAVPVDLETMVQDNGWLIEYDLELARFLAAAKLQLAPDAIDPPFLFDSGYATWQELYPGEQQDILAERSAIIDLLKTDSHEYLQRINRWNIDRVARLKAEGWRRAQAT
ncbi:MAG: hypothetical protein C4563_04400 [Desulfobulbus sp.]|nr:MAG: hypothetical protein C4563_04400 [Desulfobulbus sp.]